MNILIKSAAGLMIAMSVFSFSGCDDDSDVIGLNDATKYGYIKVTIEGQDPEGNDFEVTKNFKYFSSGAPEGTSSVYTYDDDGFYRYFEVERYISPFDDGDDSSVNLDLEMQNEDDPTFYYGYFDLETSIITDDNKFFSLFQDFYLEEGNITSYQYNPETGKLSVKFTKELSSEESGTGYPLVLTVNVSAKVFENIGNQAE